MAAFQPASPLFVYCDGDELLVASSIDLLVPDQLEIDDIDGGVVQKVFDARGRVLSLGVRLDAGSAWWSPARRVVVVEPLADEERPEELKVLLATRLGCADSSTTLPELVEIATKAARERGRI